MEIGILSPFLGGFPYHSMYSGYERLIDFIKPKRVYHSLNFHRLTKLSYPLRVARFLSSFYTSAEAERRALEGDFEILHHLYGEDTFFLSGCKVFKKDKKVVVTFHQPPNRFIRIMPLHWKKLVKNIDGIILLSPSQYDFFGREIGYSNLFLIPHGIDTNHFKPPGKKRSNDFCLSVGDHLRDYDTLVKAMALVRVKLPKLKLVIVSNKLKVTTTDNIIVMRNVSEEKLLNLYKSASFMILPLKEGTANNVLLEGMSCGLPIITTNLRDILFYTNRRGCLYYEVGNEKELADRIMELAGSERLREKLGIEAREKAEEFSWENISGMVLRVYEHQC